MQWIKDKLLGSLWRKIALIFLALLVLGLGYSLLVHQSDKIYPGVRVGKLGLGSMTKAEAKKKLEEGLDANLDKTLDLTYQDKHYRTSLRDLGYSYQIDAMVDQAYGIGRSGHKGSDFFDAFYSLFRQPLPIQGAFRGDKLDDYLHGLADDLFILARDAQLSMKDNKVHLVQDRDGRYLDTNLTKEALENWDGIQAISLPVFNRPADVQAKDLEKMDSILGEFTSDYGSSEKNRKFNIALGAEKLDHTILKPGEKISFNDRMDQITKEAGFKVAGVIRNGEFDRGVGGGICQVSTTLYNALIRADVNILERHSHSRPIGYVKNGTDAAVATGHKNLVFQNDFNHPIYIRAQADGSDLTFQVFGSKEDKDYEVKIIPKLVSTNKPRTKTIYTDALAKGETEVKESGSSGYSYRTYKEIIKDGEVLEKKQISTSNYIGRDRVLLVGTRSGGGDKNRDDE